MSLKVGVYPDWRGTHDFEISARILKAAGHHDPDHAQSRLSLQELSMKLHQPLPITMPHSVIGCVQNQATQGLLGASPGLGLGHLTPQQQHFLVSLGMLPPHAQQHVAPHPMLFGGSGAQRPFAHQFGGQGSGGRGGNSNSPFSAVSMSKKPDSGAGAATNGGHGVFVGGGGGYGGAGHGFSGGGTGQHSVGNSASRLWSEPPQVRTLTLVCDLFSPHKVRPGAHGRPVTWG